MSEVIQGSNELDDETVGAVDSVDDQVGLTSDESEAGENEKKSLLGSMTIFDAMLVVSLICIAMATLILFFELRDFGTFPGGFPWRTSEVLQS